MYTGAFDKFVNIVRGHPICLMLLVYIYWVYISTRTELIFAIESTPPFEIVDYFVRVYTITGELLFV